MSKKKPINRKKLKNSRLFPDEFIDDYNKDYSDLVDELESENEKKQAKIDDLVDDLNSKGLNNGFLHNLIISPIASKNNYSNK